MKTVMLFRRDLRLQDNTALLKALKNSDKVIPLFIFTPTQIKDNSYKGMHSFEFMINSLEELDKELKKLGSKLHIAYAEPTQVLSQINCDAVYFNKDYTPYSISRDEAINDIIKVYSYHDALLNPPQTVLKQDNTPYTIFTPYYNKAKQMPVKKPQYLTSGLINFITQKLTIQKIPYETTIDEIKKKYLKKNNPKLAVKGGRTEGLKLLNELQENKLKQYDEQRDFPNIKGTSLLSAHNKFGTISIREIYHNTQQNPSFTRQLYWRDFSTQIAFHFPKVFGNEFQKKFSFVKWDYDEDNFKKWCLGKTGFPIIDAGMRELNTTGYMHNRVRMIVASFLTKTLHIDWRWGEKYFAQKLVDYDPCINNASWQWAASTGCDAQPYFRIFNPWRQQIRFDPECEYIKKWVEELSNTSYQTIHNLEKQKPLTLLNYPSPIVDYKKEKEETLKRFNIF